MDASMILGPIEEEGSDHETIATELIHGIHEKDPEIVAKALKAFFAMCDAEEDEHEEY